MNRAGRRTLGDKLKSNARRHLAQTGRSLAAMARKQNPMRATEELKPAPPRTGDHDGTIGVARDTSGVVETTRCQCEDAATMPSSEAHLLTHTAITGDMATTTSDSSAP